MQHITSDRIFCTCARCKQKLLTTHFNAKPSGEAADTDYLLTFTEHHFFIPSPRGKRGRKVVCQLSMRS
jgi:hypothetical protein